MGKWRMPCLSPGTLSCSPRMHIPMFQSPAGLDSALLPGGMIHPFSPSGTPQGAGLQLFSLATPWESACCGSCGSSPLDPMGVCLSSPRLLCLAHFLLSCRSLLEYQTAWPHGFASDHLLCLCPHLLVHASLLKWLHSASSHTSSPSEPSHQPIANHISTDRVGQVFQGPFCPRNLVLCFPSKKGYVGWGTQLWSLTTHLQPLESVCRNPGRWYRVVLTRRCWE